MKNIFCIAAAAIIIVGCAKKGSEDFDARELASFENWMTLRVLPNHPEAVRTASGIYIERLGKVHDWDGSETKPTSGTSWMVLDYLSHDIDGEVIATRDSVVAKREGTITRVTHYGPQFAGYKTDAAFFSKAEYEALSTMSAGDSVRIWTPALLGYGTGSQVFANGYEGWRYSSKNEQASKGDNYKSKPAVIDFALRAVINYPSIYELNAVNAAVADSNTVSTLKFALLTPAADNTEEETGQYYRITHEGTVEVEGGGTEPAKVINSEVTNAIYIKYTCRFLDGKLIATNYPEVALAEWGAFDDFYSVSSYTIGSTTIIGSAVNNLLKSGKMRYSSKAEMIVTSTYGYGTDGKSASAGSSSVAPNPVIYPYTPLFITIETMKEGYGS